MAPALRRNISTKLKSSQILVLGNYQNQNLGDEAIGLGLKKIFIDSVPYPLDVKLERFNVALSRSSGSRLTLTKDKIKAHKAGKLIRRYYHYFRQFWLLRVFRETFLFVFINYKHWLRSYQLIRSSDIVVIGGGNLIMDLGYVNPVSILIYTMFAKFSRKKIFISAIGCGPVSSSFAKFIFSWCLGQTDCISVRDTYSYRVLNSFCPDQITRNVHITADPAIVLNSSDISANSENIERSLPERKIIGISTLPYQDPRYYPQGNFVQYLDYTDRISTLIDQLLDQMSASIILFPTNINADFATACDIYSRITRKSDVKIAKLLTLQDLINTINETDLILATRLHSAILAIGRGKPVIGLSYQEKVNSFFELMDLEEWVHSIDDFNSERIVEQARLLTSYEGNKYSINANLMRNRLQEEAYKNGLLLEELLSKQTR